MCCRRDIMTSASIAYLTTVCFVWLCLFLRCFMCHHLTGWQVVTHGNIMNEIILFIWMHANAQKHAQPHTQLTCSTKWNFQMTHNNWPLYSIIFDARIFRSKWEIFNSPKPPQTLPRTQFVATQSYKSEKAKLRCEYRFACVYLFMIEANVAKAQSETHNANALGWWQNHLNFQWDAWLFFHQCDAEQATTATQWQKFFAPQQK